MKNEEIVVEGNEVKGTEVENKGWFGKSKAFVQKHGVKVGTGVALLTAVGIGYLLGKQAGEEDSNNGNTYYIDVEATEYEEDENKEGEIKVTEF